MKATHFKIDGRDIEAKPYHYKECGLDNIYLANGFMRDRVDGEEFLAIENIDGLWKAICFSLVKSPRILEPKEIRFLRHHVDFTQAELAQRLRVDAQTVARWEKGKNDIPGPADVLLRLLVLASPVMQPEGGLVLEKFAEFTDSITLKDVDGPDCTVFARDDDGWQRAIAA